VGRRGGREELHQPTLTALDCLEFPELHEESIANLAFTRALTKLVTVAGVHDFSLAVRGIRPSTQPPATP
jgi:hypothetical protein